MQRLVVQLDRTGSIYFASLLAPRFMVRNKVQSSKTACCSQLVCIKDYLYKFSKTLKTLKLHEIMKLNIHSQPITLLQSLGQTGILISVAKIVLAFLEEIFTKNWLGGKLVGSGFHRIIPVLL